MMRLTIRAASASVPGRREQNEDAVVSSPERGFYAIFDGTGGRAGGRTAANIACEILTGELNRNLGKPGQQPSGLLDAAIGLAHQRIREQQRTSPALRAMATTVVALLVQGVKLHVAHVGDSRGYLLRAGHILPLTRDHSLANYLFDHPHIKPKVERPGNTLVRAIGLEAAAPEVEHMSLDLEPRDILLACSDGIGAVLPDWVLNAILAGVESLGEEATAEALLQAALGHGSTDNLSAVVLHAEEPRAVRVGLGWLAFLEGADQGRVIDLGPSTQVGADQGGVDVWLDDPFVSGRHAEIVATPIGFVLEDHNSRNGTFLNEIRVRKEVLVDGDVLRFGGISVLFKGYSLGTG